MLSNDEALVVGRRCTFHLLVVSIVASADTYDWIRPDGLSLAWPSCESKDEPSQGTRYPATEPTRLSQAIVMRPRRSPRSGGRRASATLEVSARLGGRRSRRHCEANVGLAAWFQGLRRSPGQGGDDRGFSTKGVIPGHDHHKTDSTISYCGVPAVSFVQQPPAEPVSVAISSSCRWRHSPLS
jgi:hypothetical protein